MGRVRRRAATLAAARVRKLDFVVPGDIRTPTGGYIYDREILAGLTELGWRTTLHALDASFPRPTPAALRAAREELAAIANGSVVVIDGLALPGLDRLLAEAERHLGAARTLLAEIGGLVRAERFSELVKLFSPPAREPGSESAG